MRTGLLKSYNTLEACRQFIQPFRVVVAYTLKKYTPADAFILYENTRLNVIFHGSCSGWLCLYMVFFSRVFRIHFKNATKNTWNYI